MFNPASRKLSCAALLTALTLTGAVCALLAGSAEPALALCKYGGPNCVHNGRPNLPTPAGAAVPDPTLDQDCQQYSNCGVGTGGNWGDPAVRRLPPGKKPERMTLRAHAAHLKIR